MSTVAGAALVLFGGLYLGSSMKQVREKSGHGGQPYEIKVNSLNEQYFRYQNTISNAITKKKAQNATVTDVYGRDAAQDVVFVINFFGDTGPSQIDQFREEVNAVIVGSNGVLRHSQEAANKKCTVIIRLKSGGGFVAGYGLAAAQVARLKSAGIHVIVCVDEIAASGGYMMACVADKVVAAPFATLGSIGVVQIMPNFSDVLNRLGVSVEEITAGKYKRTLTPYKPTTDEDREKTREDVNEIMDQFKAHVVTYRPQMDIDSVATGETWSGSEALKRGLCDELSTSDDVVLRYVASGARIMSVECVKKKASFFDNLSGNSESSSSSTSWEERMVEHLLRRLLALMFESPR